MRLERSCCFHVTVPFWAMSGRRHTIHGIAVERDDFFNKDCARRLRPDANRAPADCHKNEAPSLQKGLHSYCRGSDTIPAIPSTRYFSCVEILLNFALSEVPRPFTTEIIATAIPAAIKPYSMAVAPDSSARNARSFPDMRAYSRHHLSLTEILPPSLCRRRYLLFSINPFENHL